jgi:hypothetical protein
MALDGNGRLLQVSLISMVGMKQFRAMYTAGGGEYSHDAIPVDLRNQLAQQVAQTGVGNLSILEKTGNALSAGAIENMAKQGTISSLPLFMERGIPIAEAAMPTAQRYISMLACFNWNPAAHGKAYTTHTTTFCFCPRRFLAQGFLFLLPIPSQTQTLDFLSPDGNDYTIAAVTCFDVAGVHLFPDHDTNGVVHCPVGRASTSGACGHAIAEHPAVCSRSVSAARVWCSAQRH